MKKPGGKKDSQQNQIDKFRETAREVETDDREESLDRYIKQVAKAVVPPKDAKPKAAKKP